MKEKSYQPLDTFDLLEHYGLTEFHLDLVTYLIEENCNRAQLFKKDSWPFCPTCGGERLLDGVIAHKDARWDAH